MEISDCCVMAAMTKMIEVLHLLFIFRCAAPADTQCQYRSIINRILYFCVFCLQGVLSDALKRNDPQTSINFYHNTFHSALFAHDVKNNKKEEVIHLENNNV